MTLRVWLKRIGAGTGRTVELERMWRKILK
jgi:hypothetical protein